ncbi:MAG: alpha/beta hydrolase [Aquisalinus sp.]|nr:alpha/beta hydrolase [Aquisalinus sp.]
MTGKLIIDPFVFSEEAIAPETAKATAELEAMMKELPRIWEVGAPAVREARKRGEGLLAREPYSDMAEWQTATANGLEVPIRVLKPDNPQGIYFHIHGGGHTIGSADSHDQMFEKMVLEMNIAVVSVEYRLAPEDPWPAGPDDCEAAACWLIENMKSEFGTERVVIGGESAGAHLCAVTLLRMRDKHGFTGFAGANLVYGIYDMSMTPSLRNWGDRLLIIDTPVCTWFGDNLLPPDQYDREAKRDPGISPLYADLSDMPPALFSVGTLDPILDDSLFMAQRWLQAGHATELDIYPGGIHAFDAMPIPMAKEARQRMNAFIKARLSD